MSLSCLLPRTNASKARLLIQPVRQLWLMLALALACAVATAQTLAADALRARFGALQGQARGNLFDRPVYLQSTEASGRMQGDIYAIIEHPYPALRGALTQAEPWCAILILHLNVKYCRATGGADHASLDVAIGRKFDQPLSDVYWVAFDYRVTDAGADRLDVVLQAPSGPLSTKDFRIEVEAVPFAANRSLMHMGYGYAYGVAARWAMQAYLSTLGRDKVGFSIVGRAADGQPLRAGGVRGVLERNTVRYHLAIEAYLDALGLPADRQLQAGLQSWFSATERYPLQLHELDRDEYISMKLGEVKRQATTPAPPRK